MTEGLPSVPPPNAQPAAPIPPPPGQPLPGPYGPPGQPVPGPCGPPAQPPAGPHAAPAPGGQSGPYGPPVQAAPPGPYGPPAYPPTGPAQFGPPAFPPPGPAQFGPPGPYGPPPLPPPAKKSRRGLWIGLGAGAVVVLVLCVGSMFGLKAHLDEKNAASAAALDEKFNPIKPEEIEKLLADHTRALKDRDLKAFVAPFDPANKDLVARQTSLFQNLGKVPLAESRFERVLKSEFKPVGQGFTFDLTVSFVHKFDGYDLHPVEELYRWTVVRSEKGAPLKVTAAGGLPSERKRDATTYYPAPWDKWRTIHVERTAHALLIVDGSLRAEAQRYAPIAERAAVEDLAAWRAGGVAAEIPQGFVISLVKGKKELGSLYRTTKETPTGESGVAIGVPPYGARDEDQGPDVGGSRVVIDAADEYHFTKGNRARQLNIFRHELGHAIAQSLTDRAPDALIFDDLESWVVEGFAEYLGHDRKPWTTSERTGTGRATLRSLNYDLPLPSNASWEMEGRGSYHYWLAHSAMGYIAERYGEQKLFQFVAEHYRGKKINDVTQDVLGVSYADFADDWASYVKSRMR